MEIVGMAYLLDVVDLEQLGEDKDARGGSRILDQLRSRGSFSGLRHEEKGLEFASAGRGDV